MRLLRGKLREPAGGPAPTPSEARPTAAVMAVLGALAAVAPLSTTAYLPGLPEMARDFNAGSAAVQLTVSGFVTGLAIGQLLAGPLSDRYGRRRPLIVGMVVYIAAALLCALAPSITVLIAARFALGLSGAAGIVIARAVVRDMRSGAAAVRLFATLVLITGVTPVFAPLLGGQLLSLGSWRTIFVGIAVLATLMTVAAAVLLPETLPPTRRRPLSISAALVSPVRLLGRRSMLGCALTCGAAYAAMLAYISGSSFALQKVYGLSPQTYSLVLATTTLGIVLASRLSAVLVDRLGPRGLLSLGVAASAAGGVLSLGAVLADVPVAILLPALTLTVAGHGLVLPNATALALAEHPTRAGSASAALGVVQYGTGAGAAPLVGLGGSTSALPMVLVMAVLGVGAACTAWLLVPRPSGQRVSRSTNDAGNESQPGSMLPADRP
jgi:DHA1 family bicyclomycin/chloramphenicol resistance-like MFS transporter